jgi:DNA-binding response OmpR family regulator
VRPTMILIVEDDPSIARGMVDAIRSAGHESVQAPNGEAALRALAEGPFDLVLLDVMMPGLDGFEVLDRIRKRDASLPVIMVTARGAQSDCVRGLSGGADDYLVKPFGMRELLARVAAVLRRASGPSQVAATLTFHDAVVDLGRRSIVRPGQSQQDVTDREVSILEVLSQHHGQAVSRDELIQRLWGTAAKGIETRTIDIHVSRLRGKLGDGFIETVRGCGYRLGEHVQRSSQ